MVTDADVLGNASNALREKELSILCYTSTKPPQSAAACAN